MKKIVLATLLAATGLVAQAQVTISGKYSTFVDSTKTGATRTDRKSTRLNSSHT